MDPFEGRLQYLDLLRHLGASQTSQQRTAAFALKHADLDEDLHSCVLEELSGSRSASRQLNILFFLATLCETERRSQPTNPSTTSTTATLSAQDLLSQPPTSGSSTSALVHTNGTDFAGEATGEGSQGAYAGMVLRDLDLVIDAVLPVEDEVHARASLQQVRQWLADMHARGFLARERQAAVEARLADRFKAPVHLPPHTESANGALAAAECAEMQENAIQGPARGHAHRDANGNHASVSGAGDSKKRGVMSRDEVVRRMEEDRERHKRLRESLWVIPEAGSAAGVASAAATAAANAAAAAAMTAAPSGSGSGRDTAGTVATNATGPSPATPRRGATALALPLAPGTAARAEETRANDYEFEKAWEETSSLCDHDFEEMRAEQALLEKSIAIRI
ncbi:hypothetical protein PYCC9005_000430 [Savitreella phatthalungensis]